MGHPREKNDGLRYEFHNFFPCAVEISFLRTKGCGNDIPVILMIEILIPV